MSRARYGWIVGTTLWLGCAPSPPRPADPALPDKADLFGDPALVPTPQGERARAELARAGEIEAALRMLGTVDTARVSVQERDAGLSPTVLVVVRPFAATGREQLDADIRRIVAPIMSPHPSFELEVVMSAAPMTPPAQTPSWAVLLAMLGLGISIGVTGERSRRVFARLRRQSRRR